MKEALVENVSSSHALLLCIDESSPSAGVASLTRLVGHVLLESSGE